MDVKHIRDGCVWCGMPSPAIWIVMYGCTEGHIFAYSFCREHKIEAMEGPVKCALCWGDDDWQTLDVKIAEVYCHNRLSGMEEWRQWD